MGYAATFKLEEGEAGHFRCVLEDPRDGEPFDPADVTSVLATLMSLDDLDADGSPTIVNGRDRVEIKGQNGGQLAAGGVLTWAMEDADAAIGDEKRGGTRLELLLEVKYNGGTKTGKPRFLILVGNVGRT